MEEKLNMIINMLKNMDERLIKIESKLEINNISCNKMSEHINFVDDVYNNMRKPLNYIKFNIERIIGDVHTELPQLSNIKQIKN